MFENFSKISATTKIYLKVSQIVCGRSGYKPWIVTAHRCTRDSALCCGGGAIFSKGTPHVNLGLEASRGSGCPELKKASIFQLFPAPTLAPPSRPKTRGIERSARARSHQIFSDETLANFFFRAPTFFRKNIFSQKNIFRKNIFA